MGKQDLNCCITKLYGDFEKILPVKKLFWSNSLQNHMRRCEIMQFFLRNLHKKNNNKRRSMKLANIGNSCCTQCVRTVVHTLYATITTLHI